MFRGQGFPVLSVSNSRPLKINFQGYEPEIR